MSVVASPRSIDGPNTVAASCESQVKVRQARAFLEQKNYVAAVTFAREALAADGNCADALLVMAELAFVAGNADLARKMVVKASATEPDSARVQHWKKLLESGEKTVLPGRKDLAAGWNHFERQEWNAAVDCGVRALQADQKMFQAYQLLGLVCLKVGKAPEAVKMFRTATELAPDNVGLWHCLGTALRSAGQREEAAAAFNQVLKREAGHLGALLALSEVLLLTNAPSAAGELLETILSRDPANSAALMGLGHVRKRQGRLNEALRLHRQSVGAVESAAPRAANSKPRIVFVIQHGPMWTSLASVHAAFAADNRWETILVAVPYLGTFCEGSHDKSMAVLDFLKKEKMPYVRWDEFKLEPGCADLLFLPKPHDHTRPPEWRAPNLLKFVPRLVYVPYGLEIGGGEANAEIQWNLPLQQMAWLIFARSERQKKLYAEHCLAGNGHLVVTGHPKMDAIRNLDVIRDPELDAFIGGRKMIVWNAQYDVRPDGTPFPPGYSTFLRWWKFLPQEMARRPGLALVLRPHPIFFAILRQRGVLTEEEIEAFFAACTATGNIHIDRRMSYLPAFAASSAMMSDASSFLLEYAGTGRPLLYLRNPKGPGLNADGEFFTNHSYVAENEEEMRTFLHLVETGVDPRGDERRTAYSAFMHLPAGGVGPTIKRAIEQRLEAEAKEPGVPTHGSHGREFSATVGN